MKRSILAVATSAPACRTVNGLLLDKKFVAGMVRYAALWDGPVLALVPESRTLAPFTSLFEPDELPFKLRTFKRGTGELRGLIADADIALLGGDAFDQLDLHRHCRKADVACVYTIENTLMTRFQIARLEGTRPRVRRMRQALWLLATERKRREALRSADGVQANGYPAYEAYAPLNPRTLCYLDNRSEVASFVTPSETRARTRHVLGGGRLRLLHSGRLETLKGSQHIVPIALGLRSRGVDFEITVFGEGALKDEMQQAITRHGLEREVRLMGSIDFRNELVPFARRNADAFLSCNLQSDPSCTYLESMACGLPVFGYANRMWSALRAHSGGGWSVRTGDLGAMVSQIAEVSVRREALLRAGARAREFAAAHTFEAEFAARIDHLEQVLSAAKPRRCYASPRGGRAVKA